MTLIDLAMFMIGMAIFLLIAGTILGFIAVRMK